MALHKFKAFLYVGNMQKNSTHLHLHPSFTMYKIITFSACFFWLATRAATFWSALIIIMFETAKCTAVSAIYYSFIVCTILEGCCIAYVLCCYIYDTDNWLCLMPVFFCVVKFRCITTKQLGIRTSSVMITTWAHWQFWMLCFWSQLTCLIFS